MMRTFLLICLVLPGFLTSAQNDSTRYRNYSDHEVETFWDKCYTGGDLMLLGGTGQFNFNISPLLGYRPQNKGFSYGIGLTYQYTSLTDYYGSYYSYSLFGVRAFIRQNLGDHFFLHGEYENYFTKGINIFTLQKEAIIIPCANAFIGYKQNFTDYSYSYIMLGWEFVGDPYTPTYVYYLHPFVFKLGYIFDIKGK